jgi:hypothetical protein
MNSLISLVFNSVFSKTGAIVIGVVIALIVLVKFI